MSETEDPREVPHHPRRSFLLLGHEQAENNLKDAFVSGRLHSAWLIGGPRGIGKATLAYRFARFLLTGPDSQALAAPGIDVAPDHPVARRISAGSHPDLLRIERAFDHKSGRVQTETRVEVARAVPRFFAHTAGAGGWRVCIIDTADDLNEVSANVLLKTIEEPPPRSLILVLSHAPGRLLGTIRSRCVKLGLAPLAKDRVIDVLRTIPRAGAPRRYRASRGACARQPGPGAGTSGVRAPAGCSRCSEISWRSCRGSTCAGRSLLPSSCRRAGTNLRLKSFANSSPIGLPQEHVRRRSRVERQPGCGLPRTVN